MPEIVKLMTKNETTNGNNSKSKNNPTQKGRINKNKSVIGNDIKPKNITNKSHNKMENPRQPLMKKNGVGSQKSLREKNELKSTKEVVNQTEDDSKIIVNEGECSELKKNNFEEEEEIKQEKEDEIQVPIENNCNEEENDDINEKEESQKNNLNDSSILDEALDEENQIEDLLTEFNDLVRKFQQTYNKNFIRK